MTTLPSVCPLDCPAACSLDFRLDENGQVKSISGNKDHQFTAGVICKKVKNFKERLDSPKRIMKALKRVGAKGSAPDGGNQFVEIELDEALDILVSQFKEVMEKYGAESVWPYNYAGTMGWCQRDGIKRLAHQFGMSKMKGTFCITAGNAGWNAGFGKALGIDPLECYKADQIIIWGHNTQVTQIPLMAHFLKAKAQNQTKLIVVDVYETPTMKKADKGYIIKPGSDGALALGMMNIIFEKGLHDADYLKKYTDFDKIDANIFKEWPIDRVAQVTGLSEVEIMELTLTYAQTPKTILRLGYGLTRRRSGAVNLHAVSCLPAVVGHWQYEGSGAFWSQSGHFAHLEKSVFSGDYLGETGRELDNSRIGKVLTGDKEALKHGGPVMAMIIQNTNPAVVAANTDLVRQGFMREDLFTCVHEQFMTDTARYADLIIPATNFIEHDDIYSQGGWRWLHIGPQLRQALGDAIENHELINHLARGLGATDDSFKRSAKEQIQYFLDQNSLGDFDAFVTKRGCEFKRDYDDEHFLNGYPTDDGKFHFAPDWQKIGYNFAGLKSEPQTIESHADKSEYNYQLVIPPKEDRLNSTFSEVHSGENKGQSMPVAMVSQTTLNHKGYRYDFGLITLMNKQGKVKLPFIVNNNVAENLIVIEGIYPKSAYLEGYPNDLLPDAPTLPNDGLCVHDIAVDFFADAY